MDGAPFEIEPPKGRIMRWLCAPEQKTDAAIHRQLMRILYDSRTIEYLGHGAAALTLSVAVLRTGDAVFLILLSLDLALVAGRAAIGSRHRRAAATGEAIDVSPMFWVSTAWTGSLGLSTAFAFASGDPVLGVMAPVVMMGIVGVLIAKNNLAPRLTILQVALADLPFKLTILFVASPWLWTLTATFPVMILAYREVTLRLHRAYVGSLVGEAESARRARQDSLTGLLNRRGLFEALEGALDGVARGARLAVLYMDLDGFKAVNDEAGHAAGDAVIEGCARRMLDALPDGSVVGRIGGDEFVAILEGRAAERAREIADGLVERLSEEHWAAPGVPLGVSIGCAVAEAGHSADSLLNAADHALYVAKRGGRGRAETAGELRRETRRAS